MMRNLFVQPEGKMELNLPLDRIPAALENLNGMLWVDLSGSDGKEVMETLLLKTFGFHPLAVDDALNEVHVPKLDDWEAYLYLVFQEVIYDRNAQKLSMPELDVFLGPHYLVTYHAEMVDAVERVWEKSQKDLRWLQHGPDHILYWLIDELVNDFVTAVDAIEDDLEVMETNIFINPTPTMLEQLFAMKRVVMSLRRVILPQREVLNKLARDTYSMIGPKDRLFFRDVYDHMIRLHDLTENLRDLISGIMDSYLSVVNNRMNDIMKTLTVITTLFMPLSFITGFFGMNFFSAVLPLPAWTGSSALLGMMLSILLIPLGMFWWMRRRGWM